MNLFSAQEFKFPWYGVLIGLAIAIGIYAVYRMVLARGYYKDLVFDMAIIGIPLGVIGARLFYVFSKMIEGEKWTFLQVIGFDNGNFVGLAGLSIFGSILGALIAGVIIHFWKRNKPPKDKVTFLQMTDMFFLVCMLGQIIGRWGNFANQEAYGPKVDWHFFPLTVHIDAAHATAGEGYYLATFFYESMWNLVGFVFLAKFFFGRRKSFDGFNTALYCIWYGIGRAVIESLRQDQLKWGALPASQFMAILFIVAGVFILLRYLYLARQKNMKLFILVDRDLLDESYYGYKESILSHPNVYPKKGQIIPDEIEDFYAEPAADDFYAEPAGEEEVIKFEIDDETDDETDDDADGAGIGKDEKSDDFYGSDAGQDDD